MKDYKKLEKMSKQIRIDALKMISAANSGHPGGSLSAADIITVLYFYEMNYKVDDPDWPDRDRFILSKAHCCPALYAAMAHAGYFDIKDTLKFRELGSPFQGHSSKVHLKGIETSGGLLGQGLSVAIGIALAGKLDKKKYQVYCMLGDGELDEGQVWEAVMSASKFRLNNLTAIIDSNKIQLSGKVKDIKPLNPLVDKWKSFGWNVIEINGHNFKKIIWAFKKAKKTKHKPTVIIANTVKGKGVKFMENKWEWHGKPPDQDQLKKALSELK
ncbi:MAG: 1-deoxy-D-xylulose-5-phosphate synthase [Candidatus Woesearchaeota archaeon]|nr:1-deoxy-D-xylulose-5-phosphate synthase [Candidatus Woesearchaeota archaeon]